MNDMHLTRFYLSLTARQRDVLQLVCEGLSNAEAAKLLYVEPSAVAAHLTAIYGSLAVQEAFAHMRPHRFTLITLFAGFFDRHPELSTIKPADAHHSVNQSSVQRFLVDPQ